MTAITAQPEGRFSWLPAWFRSAVLAGLLAVAVSVPLTLAVVGINYAATFIDRAPIKKHVMDAYQTGALTRDYWFEANPTRGNHQYVDCIIAFMIVKDDVGTRWQRSLGPEMPALHINPCDAIPDTLEPVAGKPVPPVEPYRRFLHGFTTFSTVALAAMSVEDARKLMSFTMMLALASLMVAAVMRAYRASVAGRDKVSRQSTFIAVAAAAMLLFYGNGNYSMSMNHFPSDSILVIYLWSVLFIDFGKLDLTRNAIVHGAFGVLTAWMEFISGGIPLGLCFILYLFASQTGGDDGKLAPRKAFIAVTAFCAAFVACYALKMIITAQAFGPETWSNMASSIEERIAGDASHREEAPQATVLNAWANLLYFSHNAGAGWRDLGRFMVFASFATAGWTLVQIIRAKITGDTRTRAILLLGAFGVLFLWHMAFYPHSYLHAHFMARTLIGFYIPAAMLLVLLNRGSIQRLAGRIGGGGAVAS